MPKNKAIVITFGRFNPPTTGHAEVFRQLAGHARRLGAEALVFPTVTQDPKKNPLPFREKVKFLEDMFPNLHFNNNSAIRTPIDAFEALSKMGYTNVQVIVGSDREAEFRQFAKYMVPKKRKDTDIVIPTFGVIPSSDKRSSNTISASKLRAAAEQDDFTTFRKGTPTNRPDLVKSIYKSVRKYMNITESAVKTPRRELCTELHGDSTYKCQSCGYVFGWSHSRPDECPKCGYAKRKPTLHEVVQHAFLLYGPPAMRTLVEDATTLQCLLPQEVCASRKYLRLQESKLPFVVDVSASSYVDIAHLHGVLARTGIQPTIYLYKQPAIVSEDRVKQMTTIGLLRKGLGKHIVEVTTRGVMLAHMMSVVEAEETPQAKVPTEVDRLSASQKQQALQLKQRQSQELLAAKQRELAKKTRDDMNKIESGSKQPKVAEE